MKCRDTTVLQTVDQSLGVARFDLFADDIAA